MSLGNQFLEYLLMTTKITMLECKAFSIFTDGTHDFLSLLTTICSCDSEVEVWDTGKLVNALNPYLKRQTRRFPMMMSSLAMESSSQTKRKASQTPVRAQIDGAEEEAEVGEEAGGQDNFDGEEPWEVDEYTAAESYDFF